jgi:hypothetical protein
MKSFTLFLILALFLVVGCSSENPLDAESQDLAIDTTIPVSLEKKGIRKVTIRGSFETTFQFIPVVCIDPTTGTPVDCGVAGAIPLVVSTPFEGVGRIRPFGKTTVSSTQTVDFTTTPPTLTGAVEFTFRNGDKLYATHTGVSGVPDATGTVTFSGKYVFTGGTGKFDGASGEVKFEGTASIPTGIGEFSLRGKIKLQKSARDDDDD